MTTLFELVTPHGTVLAVAPDLAEVRSSAARIPASVPVRIFEIDTEFEDFSQEYVVNAADAIRCNSCGYEAMDFTNDAEGNLICVDCSTKGAWTR